MYTGWWLGEGKMGILDKLPRRRRAFYLGCLLTCLSLAAPNFAQQGHPLTGTWNGDWGATPTQRIQVTVVMTWDGKEVKGVINPGPDASTAVVTVDVTNWTIRFEADMKDQSGKPARVSVDGKVEDIGSYHRTISGTWRQGTTTGNFKLTRE
jgi:hypothetical protein